MVRLQSWRRLGLFKLFPLMLCVGLLGWSRAAADHQETEQESGHDAALKHLHTSASYLVVAIRDEVPVNHVVEGGNVIRATILVLEVIGVFPDIDSE